jgi:hypothetical protein
MVWLEFYGRAVMSATASAAVRTLQRATVGSAVVLGVIVENYLICGRAAGCGWQGDEPLLKLLAVHRAHGVGHPPGTQERDPDHAHGHDDLACRI